jgi:hypothetical protein
MLIACRLQVPSEALVASLWMASLAPAAPAWRQLRGDAVANQGEEEEGKEEEEEEEGVGDGLRCSLLASSARDTLKYSCSRVTAPPPTTTGSISTATLLASASVLVLTQRQIHQRVRRRYG